MEVVACGSQIPISIPFHSQSNEHKHKLSSIWIIPKPLVSRTSKVYTIQTITPRTRITSIPTIRCSSDNLDSADPENTPPNIFIKGFPLSTSEGRLRKAFSEFGRVKRVKILTDLETGESLGRAFIWMNKEEFAKLAVRQMNGTFFDGKFILVSTPKSSSIKEKRDRKFKF